MNTVERKIMNRVYECCNEMTSCIPRNPADIQNNMRAMRLFGEYNTALLHLLSALSFKCYGEAEDDAAQLEDITKRAKDRLPDWQPPTAQPDRTNDERAEYKAKEPETCTRQIGPWPCGEQVAVVLTHKRNKSDVLRMCVACADTIKDTSEYDREDLLPGSMGFSRNDEKPSGC
jgi:hypothetical protein